jgi:hypothetical protein
MNITRPQDSVLSSAIATEVLSDARFAQASAWRMDMDIVLLARTLIACTLHVDRLSLQMQWS